MRLVSPFLIALFLILSFVGTAQKLPSITMPASLNVGPEATVNLPVALSTPAPPGGVSITLSSSNPSTASVWPPSMMIPMEMTTPPRLVPTVTGHLAGTATITATADGYTIGSTVVRVGIGGTAVRSMSLSPANVTITGIGNKQSLTITLSEPAPAGGVTVNLTSNGVSTATVVSPVTIAAGSTSAVTTVTAVATGSAMISASNADFGSATASVVVSPGNEPAAAGITVPASLTLAPGDIKQYSVVLTAAAPDNGVYVTATSSDTSKVSVSQSSIFIQAGMTSSPRNLITLTAVSPGVATINVSAPGYANASTQVQVTGSTPPTPGGGTMSLSPASVSMTTGDTKVITIALSSPAGNGGLPVTLTSSNSGVASVPAQVTVGAGTATYNVVVTGVGAGNTTITATAANYGSATASVAVASNTTTPPPSSGTAKINIPASLTLYTGDIVTFPVALATPSATDSVTISLASSDPSKASIAPATVMINAGATISRRDESTIRAVSPGTVTITATANGYANATTQVQVKSSAPGGTMALSPASLSMITGNSQNLTLTLTGTIPPNGLVVYLSSSNTSAVTVPVSVTVPPAGSIAVTVSAVGTGSSTITATGANFGSATATVSVAATPQIMLPSNVTLTAGETVNFPVTLNALSSSNAQITLSSSDTTRLTLNTQNVSIQAGQMSNPNVTTTVTGIAAGTVNVTASAPGFTPASRTVVVNAPSAPPPGPGTGTGTGTITMGLSPANLAISGLVSKNLMLTISGPSSSTILFSLTSSQPGIATVPTTVSIAAGLTSAIVEVSALAVGSTVITASSQGMQSSTATVTVTSGLGTIGVPAVWSISPGQTGNFQATLTPSAPASGLTLTFTSSDTTKVKLDSSTTTISGGESFASVQLSGVAAGTANVTVSAPGYAPATTQVQVAAATGSGAFLPGIMAMNSGITQTVMLSLGPQSPAGKTVYLSSSNTSIVKVPPTAVVPANSYYVDIPVTAVAGGSATVTATVSGFGTSTLRVNVLSMEGVSVQWHGTCWVPFNDPYSGGIIWRHAMDFLLVTPKPVIVQASLFYQSSDCTSLVDNMNDFDSQTSAGHIIQGFLNYPWPYYKTASTLWWIGARTADGKCQPGSPCSGCMVYTEKTPMCDQMP